MPPLVVDVLLAVVVAIVTVISVVVNDQQDSSLSMTTWGWVFLAVQFVPLVWRRRAPVLVLLICWIGAGLFGTRALAGSAADVRAAARDLHAGGVPAAADLAARSWA